MFSRKEDPYQIHILRRLETMRRLVQTKAATEHGLNQQTLNTLSDVLGELQQAIPDFFSAIDNSTKLSMVQSLYADYHLIHLDDKNKTSLIQMTGIGAKQVLATDPPYDPNLALTPEGVHNFYTQIHRISNQRDVRAPHAIIFYQNKTYHYNHTVIPPVLAEIDFAVLDPDPNLPQNQKKSYQHLQVKLSSLEQNRVHVADAEDRKNIATLLRIPEDRINQLQKINLEFMASFLEKFQDLFSNQKNAWHRSKRTAISTAVKGTAIVCIFACFLYPFVSLFTMQLCLLGGGLFLTAGMGFALYCYQQTQFYDHLNQMLTQWKSTAIVTAPGAGPNTPVISSLPNFFKKHKAILETAFTEENHNHAGIAW